MDDSICIFFGKSSSFQYRGLTNLGLVQINVKKVLKLGSLTVCMSGSLMRRVIFKSNCKRNLN